MKYSGKQFGGRNGMSYATGSFDNFVGHKFVYGPTLSEKDLLFPIPAAEIQNNRNLIQNQGY
jgi:starch-binding outer membrane protein, SusD/RagB family